MEIIRGKNGLEPGKIINPSTVYLIKVSIKNVYGVERIYPQCKISKSFSRLMRKRTFDREEIQEIKTMGYSVQVVTEQL
jgi:hypothetical protein|tara:strand:- start:16 stop:252 length:237 start_codon:yes stop_codon:yes gene_type:complete